MGAEMTEQPMPHAGGTPVTPIARRMFLGVLDAQAEKGIATYGMPLTTDNGRDAFLDAMQEAVDLVQYIVQAMIEADALKGRLRDVEAELAAVNAEIARLRGQP
jgi:hypothetical protein